METSGTHPTAGSPFLIVGFGIAGASLAWRFRERSIPFEVVEPGVDTSASRVAPGIVNPLAGKRLKPSWRVDEQLPEALRTYEAMEAAFGRRFFHRTPILRILKDQRQRADFEARLQDPLARTFIGDERPPHSLGKKIHDPFGSFEAAGSGYLDTPALLDAFRSDLETSGCFHATQLVHKDLQLEGAGVRWQGRAYRAVVFCEGFAGRNNPFFPDLPFNPAKGEMLDLTSSSDGLPETIVNRGKWLLPLGDGRFRAGATYSWDPLDTVPTAEGCAQILQMLRAYLDFEFEVVDQRAGVRPIIQDYRPVLGCLPGRPQLAIFNGLGSKGVLSAPWLAGSLCASLVDGEPLPDEVKVSRFA